MCDDVGKRPLPRYVRDLDQRAQLIEASAQKEESVPKPKAALVAWHFDRAGFEHSASLVHGLEQS
jgi:hypothetical protein